MALSFRSAASTTARRFSGVIAASLMAATSAVAPIPAAARDMADLPPQCVKAGNELAQLKCGTEYYRTMRSDAETRSADAKARSADAKARSADAKARSADAKARSADAKARGAVADKQIAANKKISEAALSEKSCYDALLDEVNAAKKIAPLTPEQRTAFKIRAANCEKS